MSSNFPPYDPAPRFEGNAALKTTISPEPGERRRSHRQPESASGWLSSVAGGVQTNGRTVAINDLSLHGVGFTSAKACQPGDRHWLLVTRGPMRLSTRVQVTTCRERSDGRGWDVGAEFF